LFTAVNANVEFMSDREIQMDGPEWMGVYIDMLICDIYKHMAVTDVEVV
jgi:hypothetical protein